MEGLRTSSGALLLSQLGCHLCTRVLQRWRQCKRLALYQNSTHNPFRSPTAGGQYHWVSEFAPPKIQKLLSYIVGRYLLDGSDVLTNECFQAGYVLLDGKFILRVFVLWLAPSFKA